MAITMNTQVSSRMKTSLKYLFLSVALLSTANVLAQTYPFTLPATVTATLEVNTQKKEVAKDKLLGANIGGFTTANEQALFKKFDPVTVRFPSGVFINWYDWTIDANRIYDDYVPKTFRGVPDSTFIKIIHNGRNSKTGFPGLTALNNQKKLTNNGKGYSVLFGYNLLYDSNAKSVARLRDSEEKGFNVDEIELGNELFYGQQRSNATNTVQKIAAVSKSLADTLHSVKPGIKLSVPLSWRTQSGDYNAVITANPNYFDAISVHKYVGSDPDQPATFTYGDVLAGRIMLAKDVNYARRLVPNKPVWLTEWGVASGSEFQAAAGLGMADCYLFLYENQDIYDRADWFSINGLLNSFVAFVGSSRDIKFPLEKTGYGSIHEILRSVFEGSTLLDGTMTTSTVATTNGSANAVSARVVEKDGKRTAFAVNLTNKPVVFTLKLDGVEFNENFRHEALAFTSLDQNHEIGIDVDPLSLVKEGKGTITLPPLSVNRIGLDVEIIPVENRIKFTAPAMGAVIQKGTDLVVRAEAGSAVTKVDLFLNGSLVRTITGAPYQWGLDKTVDVSLADFKVGFYTLKLVATNNTSQTTQTEIAIECKDKLTQTPFSGVAIAVPGTIEAEDYDKGGEGVSLKDNTTTPNGTAYRSDNVDIGTAGDGFCISNTFTGEWREYTINVAEDGFYDFDFVYASKLTTGVIGVEFFDENKMLFNDFALSQTSADNWTTYQTRTKPGVQLTKGEHVLRMNIVARGYNLDKMVIRKAVTTSKNDTPKAINELIVYPNPSENGVFKFTKNGSWKIYNLNGEQKLEGKGNQADLSKLPQGIYFLQLGSEIKKLIYQ